MLKNYIKIALRNLFKYKGYSIINIFGLSVGIASVFLIFLFVKDEFSYDKYHENADKIYRLVVGSGFAPMPHYAGTPAPLAPTLKENFPEVENFVRFDDFKFKPKALMSYKDKYFYEERIFLADASLFEVFSFKLIRGNPENVLTDPKSIIITESMAKKYFENEDPIGKRIIYENKLELVVTGILEDVPANSHFKFDFLGSFENLDEMIGRHWLDSWQTWNFTTYVILKENTDVKEISTKINSFLAARFKTSHKLFFQPLTDIHLHSNLAGELGQNSNMTTIYLYTAVAVLILLIACINFMNLYTANSETRAKEIGIRKVFGAYKKQLKMQFLCESALFALFTLPLAILLVEFVLPEFNSLTGKSIDIKYFENFSYIGILFLVTFAVGLLSGSYPAFFVSSFKPVRTIQGKLNIGKRGLKFRNILIVFQFILSVIFISCAFVINNQMSFINNKKLGYERENILNIPMFSPETKANYETFRNMVLDNNSIIDVTATSFTPSIERWREGLYYEGRQDEEKLSFYRISGDFNFIDIFGIELISGRTFDKKIPGDLLNAFILNESAVKDIGWNVNKAVGKKFGSRDGRVIGVAKDFNFQSLHKKPMPLAINVSPRYFRYISIKIKPGSYEETVRFLRVKWQDINPGFPFEYYFYEDEFDKIYKSEMNMKNLFKYFSFLAIFIACLGLFGLSLFTVQKRIKEIGIRKVLGASFYRIVFLINRDFIFLVLIANLLSWPAVYYIMNKWLQAFAYRINISPVTIILTGIMSLAIAVFTVSFQAVKAANSNPINVIKYE